MAEEKKEPQTQQQAPQKQEAQKKEEPKKDYNWGHFEMPMR